MNCYTCQTNLPEDALCCYKCGRFIDGSIRQVEPIPVFDDEQTTVIKQREFISQPIEEPAPDAGKSFTNFLKISVLGCLIAGVIVGLVAYQKSGESNPNVVQIPANSFQTASPIVNSAPSPKRTISPSPSPAIVVSNTNFTNRLPTNSVSLNSNNLSANTSLPAQQNSQWVSPGQYQQGFAVARQLLKNDMLNNAIQSAKNRHPLSGLENCTQNVTQTFQAGDREEYAGVYQCRLKGSLVGKNIFEVQISVQGAIVWQNGGFMRSLTRSEILSDRKIN